MASRSKPTPKVRPHDVQVPPSPKPAPPGASHRRSVPQGVERTAQVLVHQAGSVPKAKKAIDTAAGMERESEFREDQLAVRLGFRSRKDLLAASKALVDGNGVPWWATPAAEDSWIVWNEETVKSTKFATLNEATRSLADGQTGSQSASGAAFPEGFNG